MKRSKFLGMACVMAAPLSGCLGGTVSDADTGEPVENALVVAHADCLGQGGCVDGEEQVQHTDELGRYVFDAHGGVHGEAQRQILAPLPGDESIRMVISKSGYQPRTVYLTRSQETVDEFLANYGSDEYSPGSATLAHPVYLCAEGAPDADGDSLCDAAEARYGTDPSSTDTDGDSIPDDVELFGDGDFDMKFHGASPLHKDIFVEVDYFPSRQGSAGEVSVRPPEEELNRVVQAMANAPVDNPDGETGIALHVLVDDEVAPDDVIEPFELWRDIHAIKAKYSDSRRAPYFHYALFAYEGPGGATVGQGRTPGRDLAIYQGAAKGGLAWTFMHELGHNLGLGHGGQDHFPAKPHYFSIMNYRHPRGLLVDGELRLDYSRVAVAGFDESALSEVDGFSPAGETTEAELARYTVPGCSGAPYAGSAAGNIDFNKDGQISEGTISANIDCVGGADGSWGPSQVDWDVLKFLSLDYSELPTRGGEAGIASSGSGSGAGGTVTCSN